MINNIQYQKSNDSNTALLSVSVWNFLHWKLVVIWNLLFVI